MISDIDKIIKKLFSERWTENLANADIKEQRKQLYKTLRDQTRGYWSGHTAYHLAVEGGFLFDAKSNTNKKLTSLGQMFMDQFTQNQPLTSDEYVLDELELEQDRVWRLSIIKNVNIKVICPHNIYEDRNSGVYRCLVCNSDELTKQDLCKTEQAAELKCNLGDDNLIAHSTSKE